jgi:transposase-like protein
MGKKRRTFTPDFRAKVALAAIRGEKTTNQIASEFDLHPVQVSQWKKQALEGLPASLEDRRGRPGRPADEAADQSALIDELYRQIGQLKVELDWLKKKSGELGRG